MKTLLTTTSAVAIIAAFMSDTCETVMVGGVRVNKSDYEADQEKPSGERQYGSLDSDAKQKDNAETVVNTAEVQTNVAPGVIVPSAPSSPNFNAPDNTAAQVATDATGAAVPTVPAPNAKLVMPEGTGAKKRFYIVDATGTKFTAEQLPGIEDKGYATETDAWNAILALPESVQQNAQSAAPAA
jgi:hypothetical protein